MRSHKELPVPIRIGLLLPTMVLFAALACHESNTVAGPSVPSTPASANLAGSWSGTFEPSDAARCVGSTAFATFEQNGAEVTGPLRTSNCGVAGSFRGTISGNMITGRIVMEGCTGGGVSGTIEASSLSLSIGDLTKPLVTGETPVMTGGIVTLHR